MYVKNAERFLQKLHFIKDRSNTPDDEIGGEFYLQIDEKIQLYAVITDVDNIFFISEHKFLKPHNKKFEDNYENFDILSEFVKLGDLAYILYKYDLITRTYHNLILVIQKILMNQQYRENKSKFEEMIDWAQMSLYYMNEEYQNSIWASEDDILEFIELTYKELNAE